MFTAKQYRAKAAEYTELLKAASLPAETREFRRLEQSYLTLAENEEWMADNREKYTVRVQTTIGMATPSSRSKGSIRSDGIGPTSQRSRLRCQQRFSSSSMTPVWAACCKRRRYGDRSPASYTSIRSTTFLNRSRRFRRRGIGV
jgi:hypothetical protein